MIVLYVRKRISIPSLLRDVKMNINRILGNDAKLRLRVWQMTACREKHVKIVHQEITTQQKCTSVTLQSVVNVREDFAQTML